MGEQRAEWIQEGECLCRSDFHHEDTCTEVPGKNKSICFWYLQTTWRLNDNDRIDRWALWQVLNLYGVGCKLIKAIQSIGVGTKVAEKVEGTMYSSFEMKMGLKPWCVTSPWLFSIFTGGVLRETLAMTSGKEIPLNYESKNWEIAALLFTDDAVLLSERKEQIQKLPSLILYSKERSEGECR